MLFVIEKDFMAISQLMREIKKIFSLLWVCILILHMKEKANNICCFEQFAIECKKKKITISIVSSKKFNQTWPVHFSSQLLLLLHLQIFLKLN